MMRFALTVAENTHTVRWRKRAGVEPTQGRVAAPTGFEGRPIHRDRFSSGAAGMIGEPRRDCNPLRPSGKLPQERRLLGFLQAPAIEPKPVLADAADNR